jgi:hypothetical protein
MTRRFTHKPLANKLKQTKENYSTKLCPLFLTLRQAQQNVTPQKKSLKKICRERE